MSERRPALTASARVGVGHPRSGRKKACGAVEQKKAQKQERKRLALIATDREPKELTCGKGLTRFPTYKGFGCPPRWTCRQAPAPT
jgi:hypothetical protein